MHGVASEQKTLNSSDLQSTTQHSVLCTSNQNLYSMPENSEETFGAASIDNIAHT